MMDIKHHGAVTGVTGSCHELVVGSSDLPIDFPTSHIRALVVTHVHIDYVGLIVFSGDLGTTRSHRLGWGLTPF